MADLVTNIKGPPGGIWYVSGQPYDTPGDVPSPHDGDMFIYPDSGDFFNYNNAAWTYDGSLRGPAGPQGPKGDTGSSGSGGYAMVAYPGLWTPLFPAQGTSSSSFGNGVVRVARTVLAQASDQLQVETASASAAGGRFRIGIWADTPTGPGSLIWQSDDLDSSIKEFKYVPVTLPAGTYWVGPQVVSTGVTVSLRSAVGMNMFQPGLDAGTASANVSAWQRTAAGTTLADPFNMTNVTRDGASALIFLRAAAS